jgi:hypothetical protein
MGQLVMTIAGGAVGSMFGMPQLGMIVGGMLGGAIFGSGAVGGPRLDDKSVSASTYGVAIPKLFGTSRMSSNLIWSAGIKEHKQKAAGGKGMGSGQKSYSYTCSFAVALCAGEVDAILRIWGDTKMIFGTGDTNALREALKNGANMASLIGKYSLGKKKKKYTIRVYTGSEDQLPDPLIVANKGEADTPAYRGLCYIVFEDFPLADFGNRIPNISAEVSKATSTSTPEFQFQRWDGGVSYAPYSFMDFASQRMVVRASGEYRTYSLRTMKQIGAFPSPWVANAKVAWTPGGGPVAVQFGNSNNQQIAILDGQTFEQLDIIGVDSRALQELWGTRCTSNLYDPHNAYFMGNGYMHGFRVSRVGGYSYFFVNHHGFGGGSIWNFDGSFVRYINRSGNSLTLMEAEGLTNYAIWNGTANGFWMDVYHLAPDTRAMQTQVPTTSCARGFEIIVSENSCAMESLNVVLPRAGYVSNIYYDQSANSLVIAAFDSVLGTPYLALYSLTEYIFTKEIILPGNQPVQTAGGMNLTGYKFGYTRYNVIVIVDLATGEVREKVIEGAGNTDTAATVWDDETQSIYAAYSGKFARLFVSNGPGSVTVGSIVSELLDASGQLTPADYDVSALNDLPVTGYLIGREATARDCITQLAGAYFFDAVESDYKLKFVKRGGASKVTILEDQMGNLEDRDIQLKEVLAQEDEAPMRVTVNYMDQDRDYQVASQYAKRITDPYPTINTRREQKAELPIVLVATDAKRMADKALKAAWVNRTSNEAMLPWRYLKYDATDVVTYTMNDGSTRVSRINKMDIGEDLTLKVSGVNESATAYISTVTGDSGSIPAQFAGDATPVELVLLNTPLLRDLDDTQGVGSIMYLSAVAPSGPFGGAYLQTAEPTSDFKDIGYVAKAPIAGHCVTKLEPTHQWASLDTTTEIKVILIDPDQTLESISYEQLMAGENLAIIGNEVIQFQNAEQVGGAWTLTNLLRARRGTEAEMGKHTAGEQFFMPQVDSSMLISLRATIDEPHQERVRAVTPGDALDDSVGLTYDITAKDLRPYSPQAFKINFDAGNVTIAWQRRSRITNTIVADTGEVAYREGDTSTGTYVYKVYPNTTPADKPWTTDATGIGGEVPVNENGAIDSTPSFTIPLEGVVPGFSMVVLVYHKGFVKGTPAYRHFVAQEDGTWAQTELFP